MRFLRYILIVLCLALVSAPARASAPAVQVSAEAAILVEASTGRVLWEKEADKELYPASMTKMMTGILTLERISLEDEVLISEKAATTDTVPLEIKAGELMSAGELLRGMLLLSDNGAAVALAEHISGSTQLFAEEMNEKAQELGMEHTHFQNPNGLTEAGHYSTARDMSKLARYVMRDARFRDIVGQQKSTIRWLVPKEKGKLAENTNELLGKYRGMTGIKTGWTEAAGGCLAASAKRDGLELIAVVMHAPDPASRFTDAKKLLDYGFARTKMVRGVNKERFKGESWVRDGVEAKVPLQLADDINYPLLAGEDKSHYEVRYEVPRVLAAPLRKGQAVGKAHLLYDGEEVGTVDIQAARPVSRGSNLLSWLVGVLQPIFERL